MSNLHAISADPSEVAVHWLTFQLGSQVYAAPLMQVSEVIRAGEITSVPGAADDLLGVRHLRGSVVPVMDGRRRLGVPALPAPDPGEVRVVMLIQDGHQVGLRVDAVGELFSTASADITPPPPGRLRRTDDPVYGVLPWHDGFVALLDVRRLCRMEQGTGDVD